MLFNHQDLKTLQEQLAYIDTAIVPIVPVDYSRHLMDIADHYEMIQYVTMGVEQQFKGRLLVLPPIQILDNVSIIDTVESQLNTFGFKNIIFVTPQKFNLEKENVHKINILPLETMDNEMKQEFVQENIKALMKAIILIWNK
ncbi:DUF2487 family protein [Macrococcoides caseolyticum]|uniref:DUF2487 family protein n=1 Tax=Macrococcoides caseolyticum TaxID=69966 RepID=UPI001F467796|nr:DUF2487 family protein [Macrococcus caseolyticus]MCE4957064.1 DUF2487 family protein [Macrococcus caseolyticus]